MIKRTMDSLLKAFFFTRMFFSVLLMAISPMALLMMIVAIIMLLDYHGAHERRRRALEEVPLTTTATITNCYENEYFCFVTFTDSQGRERYGKLKWSYYPDEATAELTALTHGDVLQIRYANELYEDTVVLAEHYDAFRNYKGYLYETGGIALVSWIILILHPEIMLLALIDDIGTHVDRKWNRIIGQT